MTELVLGIDLGTTNSVVAVAIEGEVQVLTDREGNRLIPSTVSFHPDGDILVGRLARDRRLQAASDTVYAVKRLIGRPFVSDEVRRARERFAFDLQEAPDGTTVVSIRGRTYALQEISALVLRHVRSVAEEALGRRCTQAVITVPANFNQLQRAATRAAGQVAGLDVLRVLNEPTAAALAYGYSGGSHKMIAVYDFGGGTFDVTILELAGDVFEVVATAGDSFLGGDDIDVVVAEQMARAFNQVYGWDPRSDLQAYERLRAAAEWAKCRLSVEDEVEVWVEGLRDRHGAVADQVFHLRRGEFEHVIDPVIDRTLDVCSRAMKDAGVTIDGLHNVLLVGGTTRLARVRERVADFFSRAPLATIDPDLAVAIGAAVQGAALAAGEGAERVARQTLPELGTRDGLEEMQTQRAFTEGRPHAPAFAPSGLADFDWAEPTHPRAEAVDVFDGKTMPRARRPSADVFDEKTVARASRPDLVAASRDPFDDPTPERVSRSDLVAASGDPFAGETVARASSPDLLAVAGGPFAGKTAARASRPDLVAASGESFEEATPEGVSRPDLLVPPSVAFDDTIAPGSTAGLPAADPAGGRQARVSDLPDWGEDAGTAIAKRSLPAAQRRVAAVPLPDRPPPLLLDVTAHSLGVETSGGYCETIIPCNSPIPIEQARVFGTAADNQEVVVVRVCQGESDRFEDNEELGEVQLTGLPPRPRGQVRIAVWFELDTDGTLNVAARDCETGRQSAIRINLVGDLDQDRLAEMRRRHEDLYRGSGEQ